MRKYTTKKITLRKTLTRIDLFPNINDEDRR